MNKGASAEILYLPELQPLALLLVATPTVKKNTIANGFYSQKVTMLFLTFGIQFG
jgi:hypothetical protein